MISFKDHHLHHTPPHDDNFCLIGVCNGLFSFLTKKVCNHPKVWLAALVLWSIVDVWLLSELVRPVIMAAQVG